MEKDLEEFTKLKEEAYEVFDNAIWVTLEKIQKSYVSGAWDKLLRWKVRIFEVKNAQIIEGAFREVSTAMINRKEFSKKMSGCREDIEKYIQDLTDELQNLERQLDKAYDDFVQNETGDYKWIFEQPFVKKLIFKFIQSETNSSK